MNAMQLESAVKAGLEVLGPESNVAVPVRYNDGIFWLRAILTGLAQGRLGLSPVPSESDEKKAE